MEINRFGNTLIRDFVDGDRYLYDFKYCTEAEGWKQYDTKQDASYFGVWVHLQKRKIVTFAEGDVSSTTCPTIEGFNNELEYMRAFYGEAPAAFISYDFETKTRTEYFDKW